MSVGFSDTSKLNKSIKIYNLDMIISVGYRVKSKRGILFRKWATKILSNYLMKGYSIDESRVTLYKENDMKLNNYGERITTLEQNKKEEINNNFHDRFLIIDITYLYLIGASIKDAGKKGFAISEMDRNILNKLKVVI